MFAVFRHTRSVNEISYLEEFPWIEFALSDAEYRPLLISSLCFLVLYVLGIPVLFSCLIFSRNRSHVGEFLWENYKPQFFYFELIWLLR